MLSQNASPGRVGPGSATLAGNNKRELNHDAKDAGPTLVTFYLNGTDLRAGMELAVAPDKLGSDFVPELKAWQALVSFLGNLPMDSGVPAIPAAYGAPQMRVVTP